MEPITRRRLGVIDGMGGGIGALLVQRLQEVYGDGHEIIALGLNVVATAQMLKAGANRGATGENAIVWTVPTLAVILGPLAIILAHAMLGEVTPRIAAAIASAPAYKILLPLTQERVEVVGRLPEPLPHLVEMAIIDKLPEVLKRV